MDIRKYDILKNQSINYNMTTLLCQVHQHSFEINYIRYTNN